MSKGRPSIIISKEELQKQIDLAESSNSFGNLSQLTKFIEDTTWAKTRLNSSNNIQPLKSTTIYQRMKEWGITHKTLAGKKISEKKKVKVVLSTDQKTEAKKLGIPEKYVALNNRAKASKSAAIKMNCLACSGYEPKEVRNCHITDCCMYPHRPFQGRDKNDVISEEQELVELSLD